MSLVVKIAPSEDVDLGGTDESRISTIFVLKRVCILKWQIKMILLKK